MRKIQKDIITKQENCFYNNKFMVGETRKTIASDRKWSTHYAWGKLTADRSTNQSITRLLNSVQEEVSHGITQQNEILISLNPFISESKILDKTLGVFHQKIKLQEKQKASFTVQITNPPLKGLTGKENNKVDNYSQYYITLAKKIDVVRKIYIGKSDNVIYILTIIDSAPFDDDLRFPIYDAQLDVLGLLKDNMLIDFRIININEYKDNDVVNKLISPIFNLVYQR